MNKNTLRTEDFWWWHVEAAMWSGTDIEAWHVEGEIMQMDTLRQPMNGWRMVLPQTTTWLKLLQKIVRRRLLAWTGNKELKEHNEENIQLQHTTQRETLLSVQPLLESRPRRCLCDCRWLLASFPRPCIRQPVDLVQRSLAIPLVRDQWKQFG